MPNPMSLTDTHILASLCRYDSRNPASADLDCDEREPVAAPGCSCDNCFYGRHALAAALLEARANPANFEPGRPA
jgi:hypothetical protein